jgi:hypothetical protein
MEQHTLPTDTNEIPNLPSRDDVKTWWLSNEEAKKICPTSKVTRVGYIQQFVTQKLVRQGEWKRKVIQLGNFSPNTQCGWDCEEFFFQ